MKITILTTFPEMFTPLHTSMLGRAEKAGILDIREVDIRAYSKNKHHNTVSYTHLDVYKRQHESGESITDETEDENHDVS